MINSSSSEDMRMQQIQGQILDLEGNLEHIYGYVDGLTEAEQLEARGALRRAFEVGRSMGDLERFPPAPPLGENGELLLGPELRHHITAMRRVYGDIEELKQTVSGIFGDVSHNHLHSLLRRERKGSSRTASVEFDIAA